MSAGAILAALSLFTLQAQGAASQESDESLLNGYQEARALRDAAGTAYQMSDYESARRLMVAAEALQPGHAGILRGQYQIAMRDEDFGAAIMALRAIADAGLTYEISANDREHLVADHATALSAIEAALQANAAPVGSAQVTATIPDANALIESVAVDIETERLYVGSVKSRSIYMIEPFSRDTPELFADAQSGLQSVFGMAVDRRNRLLFVTTGAVSLTPLEEGEQGTTALMAFDLSTGQLYRRYDMPDAGQMGDLTVRDGIVYVTDAQRPRIYRLENPESELEVYLDDPRFASLQGIAHAQGALWVADYAQGLWHIDPVSRQASLTRSPGESLIGLDGLSASRNGVLYAVRNGGVPHSVLRLDVSYEGDIAQITPVLRGHSAFMEPTLIRIADERAFLVANSQWPRFSGEGDDGIAPEPTRILTWSLDEGVD